MCPQHVLLLRTADVFSSYYEGKGNYEVVMPDCKERIYSNEYGDIILDYSFANENQLTGDYCYQIINDTYVTAYVNRRQVESIGEARFGYSFVPKLYGLTVERAAAGDNSLALEKSGILEVRRAPLGLTGRGVILAFVDTGERVKTYEKSNMGNSSSLYTVKQRVCVRYIWY